MEPVERPILFSAQLVRAILAGRKTETRRLVSRGTSDRVEFSTSTESGLGFDDLDWGAHMTAQPCAPRCDGRDYCSMFVDGTHDGPGGFGCGQYLHVPGKGGETRQRVHCRICPGDKLWVREAFNPHYFGVEKPAYRADWDGAAADVVPKPRWTPSIHMPRWASRIDLRVKAVRVERLQQITGAGVLAEGVDNGASNPMMGARWENMQRMAFERLWDQINGKQASASWDANPWVWVIGFELESVRVRSSQPRR